MIFLFLPILIPLFMAASLLLLRNRHDLQRRLGVAGSGLLAVASIGLLLVVSENGIQAVQVGDWPAPFGITLVADLFSAIMVVLSGIIGFAVMLYSLAQMDSEREAYGYYPLNFALLMGVNGAFLTGDIFNLYVWFEVMLIASFVLIALGGEPRQLEGAIKYVTINLVSSAIFLTGTGILYSAAGTLNMADLAVELRDYAQPGLVTTIAMLFLVSFGIKAAIFPLFFWLPASYHTPPAAVSAIFAGLLTKVGVYALIRVFTLIFVQDVPYTHSTLLMLIAGFTMLVGVLSAASQNEFRRILSFHIISQIGYMIMGLAIYTPLAVAGAVFYIMHHIIVKTNLFLVSGLTYRIMGKYDLKHLGGFYRSEFMLSLLFLVPALSLAGIPPLSGFWAKYTLIASGLEAEQYVVVATALVVSVLTLYSMTKIWAEVFWKPKPDAGINAEPLLLRDRLLSLIPIVLLAVMTLLIGLLAEPLVNLAMRAADQLLNPAEYIWVVLGGGP